MTAHFKNFIAGDWVDGEGASNNINPSNTGDVVGEFVRAGHDQAATAIAAAKAAFPKWSHSTPQERHDVLLKISTEILARKDELGRLLAREEGKTLPEGIGEVARAGQIFDFFAGEALRLSGERLASVRPGVEVEITRDPIGVVGLITPWNFPIAIPAWKIAPALCHGNCVVFKPADLVPGSAHALSDIISRSGLPQGVFNLVMGRGSVVGEAFLHHKDVSAISFTGSAATGRKVAAACIERFAKFQLEMSGKNPLIVLDDADLKIAVEVTVQGAFFSTGQRCTASSRIIVTEGIHDRFVAALVERTKGLVVDDALKAGTQIGPVVDKTQLDKDLEYVAIGLKEGAKLAAGGEVQTRDTPGFYLAPRDLHRGARRHAHRPRRDLRADRSRDPGQGLRGSARLGERFGVRPLVRHLHDQPETREPLQAQRRGRDGDGQPRHRGRRLSRAVRGPEGFELRPARTGPLRG